MLLQPLIDAIHISTGGGGWLELPDSYGAALWGVSKGRTHAYIKRVPKAGGGYRYFYHVGHGGGIHHEDHFVPGASFKFDGGHYHIKSEEGGKLTIEHDETKERKTVSKSELRTMLGAHHEPAIKAHREKVAGMLAEARANKASPKQIARLEARVGVADGMAESSHRNDAIDPERGSQLSAPQRTAVAAIERATGFTLTNAEVSMDVDGKITHLKMEAKSPERWVVAMADAAGRGIVETFTPTAKHRRNLNRFDGIPISWEFSGRQKVEGARHTARAFAHYLGDNAKGGPNRIEARKAVAALLSGRD